MTASITAILRKMMIGFLSTLIFVAVFAIAGDVLIAACAAIAVAASQFILAATAKGGPRTIGCAASLASLSVVVVLTGETLAGTPISESPWSPTPIQSSNLDGSCARTQPI